MADRSWESPAFRPVEDVNPNRPPLWKLILHMRVPATPWHELKGTEDEKEEIAAELRAIADWLVPEEYSLYNVVPSQSSLRLDSVMRGQRAQRQDIRAMLLAEADRAEAGG